MANGLANGVCHGQCGKFRDRVEAGLYVFCREREERVAVEARKGRGRYPRVAGMGEVRDPARLRLPQRDVGYDAADDGTGYVTGFARPGAGALRAET